MDLDRRERIRAALIQVVVPILLLGIAAMWLGSSGADTALLVPFFDVQQHDFTRHGEWFYDTLLHDGGKYLIIAAASVSIVLGVVAAIRKQPRAKWGTLLYPAVCLLVTVAIAGEWKHLAHQGTPADLVRFGGKLPTLEVHTPRIFGLHLGSPAAHASSGFAWISLYFVAVSIGAARPWLWVLPGAVLGLAFAVTQNVRGAHVPSHNLWSIAIAWGVAAAMAAVFRRYGLLARADTRAV
jgi:membrane-associated PAP2 superfamily phosphatase